MWQQTKSAVLMSSHSTADEKEPSVSIKVHSETKVKLETYFSNYGYIALLQMDTLNPNLHTTT